MTLPRIAGWISREDYEAFKAVSPDLPASYEEWLATQQTTELEAHGGAVEKVVMNPYNFSVYCNASGMNPDSAGRAAFAVAEHRRKGERRRKEERRRRAKGKSPGTTAGSPTAAS